MRENIGLFKAKRKDNGEWIVGYYLKRNRKSTCEYCEYIEEHFISNYMNLQWEDIEIDPETLCEFTGLYDKNKNKIWENDIVKLDNNKQRVKYCSGFYYPFVAFPEYNCWCSGDCKVIGNIFDNPKLLEVK